MALHHASRQALHLQSSNAGHWRPLLQPRCIHFRSQVRVNAELRGQPAIVEQKQSVLQVQQQQSGAHQNGQQLYPLVDIRTQTRSDYQFKSLLIAILGP